MVDRTEQGNSVESSSLWPELIQQKLDNLPARPGCYVFYDKEGNVLYVGKAKSLRARVRSYFQEGSSDTRAFIALLPRLLGDLTTYVTSTEKEAMILENSLIKEQKPRLNVKLRDDKEYLNLRLDLRKEWPRLELVRRPAPDGARYFGPYHSATAARKTLHLVEKHFQLRTCSDRELKSRSRPCIQHQIGRCPAPCVYEVDPVEYGAQVRTVELFLAGRHDELTKDLEQRMQDAARSTRFEIAAIYRDQIDAVRKVKERQRVVLVTDIDQDVLGLYREGDLVELSVVYVRQGRVVEICSMSQTRTPVDDDEIVATFLREHYGDGGLGSAFIPDEILVPVLPEVVDGITDWLHERRQALTHPRIARPQLLLPQRGPRTQLLALARENAQNAFDEKRRTSEDIHERLASLQAKLRLPRLPRRIECCDISHLGGEATVGSVVALTDGVPDKKRYKAYHVRSVADGDDYAAMYEVLFRRFRRGMTEQAPVVGDREAPLSTAETSGAEIEPEEEKGGGRWALPDLFVVDGGRGQLGVALAVAADLGLEGLPLAGLAKERETVRGDKMVDRVYLPGQKNPIALRPNTPELFFLARARDEAHRFANFQRERLGKKRRFASHLDDIVGIGPKTRTALLKHFGGVPPIADASDEEILAIQGVTRRHLAALRNALGSAAPPDGEGAGGAPAFPGEEADCSSNESSNIETSESDN